MSSLDLVWLNGEYLTAPEASVSVFDRGLAYGDGAFTPLRVGGVELDVCVGDRDRRS